MTNNQNAMTEICVKLGIDEKHLHKHNDDLFSITKTLGVYYVSISLFKNSLYVNKLNTLDEGLIIKAVESSSFVGVLNASKVYGFK
jgi:hypothetical protein